MVPDDKQLDLIDYLYQHAVDKKEKTALIALTEDDHQIKLSWNELADAVSTCLLYTSPSPRDLSTSRMPSSA